MSSEYKLWAFDTEDDGKGGFVLGAVTDGEKIWYFERAETMRRWIESCPDVRSRFVAHNLEYDLGNLYRDHYDLLRPKWNRSRLLWAEARGMRARYFNSFCHAPIKLAEMGEIIGHPKMDLPYWKIRKIATWRVKEYLGRDVEILWRFMNRLQKMYLDLGGRLCPTAPGSAMSIFRAWTPEYCSKKLDVAFLDILKTAYYGGRTEAFFMGRYRKTFHYSDVHSMYPWAMLGDFPNFHIWEHKAPREGQVGIVDATVSVASQNIPPLPVRGERLTFPVGTFRGTWTREELDRSHGFKIEKIHQGVTFPVSAGPVLSDYVRGLYAKRLKATTAFDKWLFKLLMNSLYGKFASSPTMWTLISEDEYVERSHPSDPDCVCASRRVWDGTLYLVMEANDGYPVYTNFIWPSLITGRARMRLYDDARALEKKGGEVFYCDTDSMIYADGKKGLPSGPGMGEWGTETHSPPEDLEIKGPKMYRIGKTYTVKGVPKAGFDEYGNATQPAREFFETGHARFRRPIRMREALARKQAKDPTTPDEFSIPNYWVEVEKEFHDTEGKRIWRDDGRSDPIRVKK